MSATVEQDNGSQRLFRGAARLSPIWNRHRKKIASLQPHRERKIWSPPWRKKTLSIEALPSLSLDSDEQIEGPPLVCATTTETTPQPQLKGCLKVRTLSESLHGSKQPNNSKAKKVSHGIEFEEEADENCPSRSNLSPVEEEQKTTAAIDSQNDNDDKTDTNIKYIRFSTVEFREYPICVGDSPALTAGPPLTIAWDHDSTIMMNVDEYEEQNPSHERLMEDDLMIPSHERYQWLLAAGHSQEEIYQATQLAEILKRQRTGLDYGLW